MRPPKHPVIDGRKLCSKCLEEKPHTLVFFVNSHGKAGRALWAARQRSFYGTPAGKRSYRNSELIKKYGITLDQYEHMLRSQGGSCAHCNTGLGAFQDNPLLLNKAASYLRKHGTLSKPEIEVLKHAQN